MAARNPLDDPRVLQEISGILKAMADPTRLRLLQGMMDGERTVSELVEACGTSQANVSKHLAVLRAARIVEGRREGVHVVYRICAPFVQEVCTELCRGLADRLGDDRSLQRKVRRILDEPAPASRRGGAR
jgi:DNA-binding transcriptional ArsR family regulator